MKPLRCCFLFILALLIPIDVYAGPVPHDFGLRLRVVDPQGKPVPEFEVIACSMDQGSSLRKQGKDGEILLQSKDGDFSILGITMQYKIIIKSKDFTTQTIDISRPENVIERTVKLNKGQRINLILTTNDKRPVPDALVPTVMFSDFRDEAWFNLRTIDGKRKYNFDRDFISLTSLKEGHYTFVISEDFPEVYIYIDQPGFIRGFRAGPFGRKELSSGKLEIELPKPAELEVAVEPPGNISGKLPYDAWQLYLFLQSSDDASKGYILAEVNSDKIDTRSLKEFFAPGDYWLVFETRLSNSSSEFRRGQVSPAYYRDMKKYSLVAGQTEKAVFGYAPYDENQYKGNYSVSISVNCQNGKPAAGRPYVVYYEDKHFGSVKIKDGNIPDNGQLDLNNLRGGTDAPYFTLEIDNGNRGRYFFQLDGQEKHRSLEYKIVPVEEDIAPDVTLMDVSSGKKVKLADCKGKLILMEFWETGCGPCQKPLADLCEIVARRNREWKDKIEVWAVSIDTNRKVVEEHVRSRGWLSVRHLWCDDELGFKSAAAQAYGITGVPTSLLIDQKNKIVWRGHPASVDIEAKISELLKTE